MTKTIVQEVIDLVHQRDEIDNEIEKLVGGVSEENEEEVEEEEEEEAPKKHRKVSEKNTKGKKATFPHERALKMLEQGSKPGAVAKELGCSVQSIYQLKSDQKKRGGFEAPKGVGLPKKKELSDDDLELEDDEDVADQIKDLWTSEGLSSLEVCKKLNLTLGKFNRLIMKYNIAKDIKEPGY